MNYEDKKYRNNYSNNSGYKKGNRTNNFPNYKRNNVIKNTECVHLNKEENKQIYEKEYNNFGENQINNSQKYYSSKEISEAELINKKIDDALKKEKEAIKAELENKKSEYEEVIKKLKIEYEDKIKLKENQYTKEIVEKEEENKKLKKYLKEEKKKVDEMMYEIKNKEKVSEKLTNNLRNQLKEKDSEIEQLKRNYEKLDDELKIVKNEHNLCSKEIGELKALNLQMVKEKYELINSLEGEKNKKIVINNSLKNKEDEILSYKKKFKIIKDVLLDKGNAIEDKKTYKDMSIDSKDEEEEEDEKQEEVYNFENNKNNGKIGIDNEELNCYMSSVLQIIKNLKDFSKLILKNNKNNDNILVSLKNLIKSLYYSREQSVSLIEFKTNFSKVYKKFEGSRDNDSTFFLIYLFQHLQKIFLRPKRVVTDISEFSFLNLNFDEKQELIKFLDSYEPKNYSAIHDLFFGYQMSEIICSGCNKRDISFQSFNILHLSLYDEITKLTSLEQCINSFLYTKDKKGFDNFNCSKCRRKCLSHVISIVKLPPNLIINLKRVGEKYIYNHDISIPFILKTKTIEKLENFDMEYELIGYINHFGNEKSGHNVAYSKNIFDNKWYRFNDSEVVEINKNKSTNGSFLLFYQLKK